LSCYFLQELKRKLTFSDFRKTNVSIKSMDSTETPGRQLRPCQPYLHGLTWYNILQRVYTNWRSL
jgi:hypothetical protein